jgi:PAS domain S-box-containing protein
MKHTPRPTDLDETPAWQRWSGVVLTVALIAGLVVLERLGTPASYPAPVIILVLVYTGLSGGLLIGTLATALVIAFTFVFFSEPGTMFRYSADNIQRLIGYTISLPVITLMVGLLKQRADQRSATLLDQSEARFRATFEEVAAGIAHIGLDGQWLRVNRRMCELTRYTADELLSRRWRDVTPPDNQAELRAAGQRMIDGDSTTYTSEQQLLRADGSAIWISLRLSLVRSVRGQPAYFIALASDITDRKEAEAQIQQQARRAEVLDELSQAVAMAAIDNEQVLAFIVQRVAEEVGDGCVIRLIGDDQRVLGSGIGYHVDPAVHELVDAIQPDYAQPVSEGLHGRVVQTGEAVLLPIIRSDDAQRLIPSQYEKYAAQRTFHSLLIVPMRVRGSVIGTLTLVRDQTPTPYTPDDRRFVQDVADRAALGVANARLFNDLQRELTERERAEAAVRGSEQRYRLVARATNDVLWDWNLVTDQILWNDAVTATFRYSEAEVQPTIDWWTSVLHPDDRDRVAIGIRAALANGCEFWSDEYRFRCGDGSYAAVLDRGYVVHDHNGTPVRMIGSIQDVTERRRAEQALAAEKERLAVTLGSIGDAVITTDTGGRITLLNPAAEQLTGWHEAEVLGRVSAEVLTIVEEHSGTALPDPVAAVLRAQQPVDLYKRALLRSRDGRERLISDSGAPIRDTAGTIIGVVLVFRDITQRAQLEQQLQHAQKMESIGILAGGIAHDFNNILTGIIGTADLLLLDLAADHPLRSDIENIRTQGDRGAALTRQLLAFSRRQAINPQPSELNAIVRNVAMFIRRVLGSRVALCIQPAAHLPLVNVDPPQIEQVLLNLCINARDAMPDGGTITIATTGVELDEAFCATHVGADPGLYVRLDVSDTGVGMSAETLQQMFEPFFTTKEPGKGTGLGLAMVYGIIQQHNGLIDVQSEPGSGTTVSLYLPTANAVPEDLPPAEQRAAIDGREGILVIENDEVVRTLMVRVLEARGYHVITAMEDRQVLELLATHGDHIDLVLFDPALPPGERGRLLLALRERYSGLNVLLVSSAASDTSAADLAADPSVGVLSKPFTADQLTRTVRALLDRATELREQ